MPSTTFQTWMRRVSRPGVWVLALALLVYGQSSVLLQLLGPTHRHAAAQSALGSGWLDRADVVFRDIRLWRAELRARLLPGQTTHVHADGLHTAHPHPHPHTATAQRAEHDDASHAHAHAAYQRHHHDVHDATVVSIGGQGGATASESVSAAGSGSATLTLALAPRLPLPVTASCTGPAWCGQPPTRWTDAAVMPLEHPPRA
jgi:hypothetical protein